MTLTPGQHNRLCIYVLYHPTGQVDEYVLVFLRGLLPHVKKLLVVCNGTVTDAGRAALEALGAEVLVRDNQGYDVSAWREGLLQTGREAASAYDEVILTNDSIAGPVHPFGEMFGDMDARNLDFWGMTCFYGENHDPWGLTEDGVIPPHLQSFFLVFRQSLVDSGDFWAYWQNLPPIRRYEQAVCWHEAVCTRHFGDLGYQWAAYVQADDLAKTNAYPLMHMPYETLVGKRCPVFKLRSFSLDANQWMLYRSGGLNEQLLAALEACGFDARPVLRHAVGTIDQHELRRNLDATLLLNATGPDELPRLFVAARVMDSAQATLLAQAAVRLAGRVDFVVYAGDEALAGDLRSALPGAQVLVQPDATPFDAAEKAAGYAWAAWLGFEDPMPPERRPMARDNFFAAALDALLPEPGALADAFTQADGVVPFGLLQPPSSLQVRYRALQRPLWEALYSDVQALLKRLDALLPMDSEVPPGSPLAGMWWLRGDLWPRVFTPALQSALGENQNPGALLNMALPFLAQSQGSLAATLLPDGAVGQYVGALHACYELEAYKPYAPTGVVPGRVYLDYGEGFSAYGFKPVELNLAGGDIRLEYTVPKDVAKLRFDPIEGFGFVATGAAATKNGAPLTLFPETGQHIGAVDLFVHPDPYYVIHEAFAAGDKLEIRFDTAAFIHESQFGTFGDPATWGGPLREAAAVMAGQADEAARQAQELAAARQELADTRRELEAIKASRAYRAARLFGGK